MRKIVEYILLVILVVVITVYVYSFFPTVEGVKYSDQKDDRFKNYLEITVNSKSNLVYGGKGFLSFKRDHYTLYFTTRGKTYTEQDIMDISIYGTKNMKIKPQRALVKIENNNSGDIVVNVDITDERIPKLINGSYLLRVAESNPAYVWYKLKLYASQVNPTDSGLLRRSTTARNSIELVLVGGMAVGTIFTLFVIPSICMLVARDHSKDRSYQ